jgi:enoyl-CoA hydratase
MSDTGTVLWRDNGAWGEITLNRPEKGNALTAEMLELLDAVAGEVAKRQDLRVVVLRGAGDRFFCTGGDIQAWGALTPSGMARGWILRGIEVFSRIARLPQVVIAAVNGHALGGGLELALAADLRVAAARAKLGTPEATLGIIPGWLGTRRLAEVVGVSRARHLTLLGTPIPAAQALDWGLVTAVAGTPQEFEAQVTAWRERLCGNAPVAMSLIKGILETMHGDLREHHASAVGQAAATEDCREGVQAFLDKRPPVFRNR